MTKIICTSDNMYLQKWIRKNKFFQGRQNPPAMIFTRASALKIFSFAKDTVLLRPQAAASKTVFASLRRLLISIIATTLWFLIFNWRFYEF